MADAAAAGAAGQTTVEAGWKVKRKKPGQRTCDERDDKATLPAKSKVCCGHLKRWYDFPADADAAARKLIHQRGGRLAPGHKPELYRCEICRTLYLADPAELPRSYTHRS